MPSSDSENKKSEDLARDLDHLVEMRSSLSSASSPVGSSAPSTKSPPPSKRSSNKTRVIRKPVSGSGRVSRTNKPSRSSAAYEEEECSTTVEEKSVDVIDNDGVDKSKKKVLMPSRASRSNRGEMLNKKINSSESTGSINSTPLDISSQSEDQSNFLDKLEYSKEYSMLLPPNSPENESIGRLSQSMDRSPLGNRSSDEERQSQAALMQLSLDSSTMKLSFTKEDNSIVSSKNVSTTSPQKKQKSPPSHRKQSRRIVKALKETNNMDDSAEVSFTSSYTIQENSKKQVPSVHRFDKQVPREIRSPLSKNTDDEDEGVVENALHRQVCSKFGSGQLADDMIVFFRNNNIETIHDIEKTGIEEVLNSAKRDKMKPIPLKRLKSFISQLPSPSSSSFDSTSTFGPFDTGAAAAAISPNHSPPKVSYPSGTSPINTSSSKQQNMKFQNKNKDSERDSTDVNSKQQFVSVEKRTSISSTTERATKAPILKVYALRETFSTAFGVEFRHWIKNWMVLTNQFLIAYSDNKVLKCETVVPIQLLDLVLLKSKNILVLHMHDGSKFRVRFLSSVIAKRWKNEIYESMIHMQENCAMGFGYGMLLPPPPTLSSSRLLNDSLATIYAKGSSVLKQHSPHASSYKAKLEASSSSLSPSSSNLSPSNQMNVSCSLSFNSSFDKEVAGSTMSDSLQPPSSSSSSINNDLVDEDVFLTGERRRSSGNIGGNRGVKNTMITASALATSSSVPSNCFDFEKNEESLLPTTCGWKSGNSSGVWHQRLFMLTKNEIIYCRKLQPNKDIHVKKISLKKCCLVVHKQTCISLHFLNSFKKINICFENEEICLMWKHKLYDLTVLHKATKYSKTDLPMKR